MSVQTKIRAHISFTGHKVADLSDCLGKSVPSVRNKFSTDAFSINDLLRIADFTNARTLIRLNDGQEILFSRDDITDNGSVSNKLRALLLLTGHNKLSDLADCLGMSSQGVRNKFSRNCFTVNDLIKICGFLDCSLLTRTHDGQEVVFTMDDVRESSRTPAADSQEK